MRLETTRKSDLAAQALITLARRRPETDDPDPVKAAELAESVSATPSFMAHVMSALVSRGWVTSDPGRNGGYRLVVGLDDISVLDLVEAVEGPTDTGRCVVGDRPCGETGSCALHDAWMQARAVLTSRLAATSIADVAPTLPTPAPLAESRGSES